MSAGRKKEKLRRFVVGIGKQYCRFIGESGHVGESDAGVSSSPSSTTSTSTSTSSRSCPRFSSGNTNWIMLGEAAMWRGMKPGLTDTTAGGKCRKTKAGSLPEAGRLRRGLPRRWIYTFLSIIVFRRGGKGFSFSISPSWRLRHRRSRGDFLFF